MISPFGVVIGIVARLYSRRQLLWDVVNTNTSIPMIEKKIPEANQTSALSKYERTRLVGTFSYRLKSALSPCQSSH